MCNLSGQRASRLSGASRHAMRRQFPAGTTTWSTTPNGQSYSRKHYRGTLEAPTHSSAFGPTPPGTSPSRSEEHTSELQSRPHLVCRLLLEKKNKLSSRSFLLTNNNTTKHIYMTA